MEQAIIINTQELEDEQASICAVAGALVVENQGGLDHAGSLLLEITTYLKRLDAEFDGTIKSAHEQHKKLVAWKAGYAQPAISARDTIKACVAKYLREVEVKRLEAQRFAELEAAQAERARREIEAAAMLAQATVQAEASASAESSLEILTDAATKSKEIVEAPVFIAPAVVTPEAVAPKGLSTSEKWCHVVVDERIIPREYLMVNEKKIAAVVRAMKGETRIAGVRVYADTKITVRTGK